MPATDSVKFTMQSMIDQKNSINLNAAMFRDLIQAIETPDPYTVIVRLNKVSFDFLYQLNNNPAHFTIASKKYVESVGRDEASKRWIGSGPWKFVEYKSGNYVKFQAVENHWRKTPEFQTLILREVPDPASRLMMLRSGEIDFTAVTLENVTEVEQAGLKVVSSQGHPFWMVFGGNFLPTRDTFKKDIPWVGDPADQGSWDRAVKVRKAMNLAIDKEKILRTVLRGKGELTVVPGMRPDHPGYDPNWKQYPYDPAAAKKLLQEAGYPNGFPLTITLYALGGRDEMIDLSQTVGMYLSQIGLDVKFERVEYQTVARPQIIAHKLYGLFQYSMSYDEAIIGWNRWGQSKASVQLVGEHPWLDEMIGKAAAELDYDKRAKLQREIGQWYIDNAWTIPIAAKQYTFAANPKTVKNANLPPLAAYLTGYEYFERMK